MKIIVSRSAIKLKTIDYDMQNKQGTIKKIYYDLAGYGSMNRTLKDAREIDLTIKMSDVKYFFDHNIKQKTQARGYNSFVANEPYYEYQVDLFFINHLDNQKFKIGMICIDVFSKYCVIVPIKSKSEGDLAHGLLECIHKMGKTPKVIYSDGESGLQTNVFKKYYRDEGIIYVATRTHPSFAERMISTFKMMLDKRLDNSDFKLLQWTDYIFPILLTYNNKLVHSSTGFTPNDARKRENLLDVYVNLKSHAQATRKYPITHAGDKVRVYRKRKKEDKAHVSVWSDATYEIKDIIYKNDVKFYITTAREDGFLRHELLKVSA